MQSKIKILPEFIANQIAAGEVVQRPESVVKELVENSIDAGADTIVLIVKKSGKNLIHIVDNGSGMSKDDLSLSIRRHATSKVFTSDDLEQIKTFGFRGEALASVCSVASIEIRTKTIDEAHGWQLISEPNKEEVINPFNTENGTQIFVRNLFYNVPARRKFLKSDMTEFRYISETMIKFALSHPEIRFTFYDDNELIFDVKSSNFEHRISDILGEKILDKLIPVHFEGNNLTITGYIGEPEIAKQNRSGQYLFLNNRTIFSANLSHAINSVFESFIERNYKPFFILKINIDFTKVDINIHPQKNEVKFDDESYVYNAVKSSTTDALMSRKLIPDARQFDIDSPFIKLENDEGKFVNKLTGEIISEKPSFNLQSKSSKFRDYRPVANNYDSRNLDKIESAFNLIFNKNKNEMLVEADNSQYFQIFDRFIIRINKEEIYIYDQNSVHRRIIYNQLKDDNFRPSTQKLLFPISIELNKDNHSFLNEHKELLNQCGFYFVIEDKLNFYEIPDLVKEGNETEILSELVNTLLQIPIISNFDILDKIYLTISNSLAVKTGQKLSLDEMKSLTENIEKCENKLTSPSNKRTFTKMNAEQFYQKFLRL